MDDLIDDIEFAVKNSRWLIALAGALSLPDICAALQSENGQTTGSKYKWWVQDHLAEKYPRIDPEEIYKLRCSFLHQGTTSTVRYSRIVFSGPDSFVRIHNNVVNNEDDAVLMLDLPTFCSDIIGAVKLWRSGVEDTNNYQKNIDKLTRWRPLGLEPYVVGRTVLT